MKKKKSQLYTVIQLFFGQYLQQVLKPNFNLQSDSNNNFKFWFLQILYFDVICNKNYFTKKYCILWEILKCFVFFRNWRLDRD